MSPPRNSIMEHPILDGKNYPEWKVKMEQYIKAIVGMNAWISIRTGWNPPTMMDDKGRRINKPEINWTESEYEICGYNSKAMNAIFCSVGLQQFKRIATCNTAKEAWEILQTAYEKSGMLREEELLILTSRFNNLLMDEDETISSFYEKLVDIAYEAGTLGRPYSNQELVSKILWSLPERFMPKIALIIECDVKLGELIGSLKAYEHFLERFKHNSKKKSNKFECRCRECGGFDYTQSCVRVDPTWSDEESNHRERTRISKFYCVGPR